MMVGWTAGRGQAPTIGEIQSRTAPATFRVAFHFVGAADSSNFVLEGKPERELLRADVFVGYLLREMNERYATAVIGGTQQDSRIRFAPVNGREDVKRSIFLYGHDERPRYLPDAMNIVFTHYGSRGKSPDGSTDGAGSNRIRIYNRLERIKGGEAQWWSIARVIDHEIGHTQGLDHTFKCDNPCGGIDIDVRAECYGECATNNSGSVGKTNCYGSSKRELMMGYGSQVYLTVCETELMWKYLLAHRQPWVDYGMEVGAAPW